MTILAFGNPADGFTYVGPFDSSEDAISYAEIVDDSRDWWAIDVTAPDAGVLSDDPS